MEPSNNLYLQCYYHLSQNGYHFEIHIKTFLSEKVLLNYLIVTVVVLTLITTTLYEKWGKNK